MFDAPSAGARSPRRFTPFRSALDRYFSDLAGDPLTIRYPDGSETRFGQGDGAPVRIAIADWRTVLRICINPDLAFGEAYMDGAVSVQDGDIYTVLERITAPLWRGRRPTVSARLRARLTIATRRIAQYNSGRRARRNVQHHYDIGLEVFRLVLDPDLQYSCAYFPTGAETLAEAQEAKKRHIAAKLRLDRPGLRVLDIGCGWGGLALTLARDYGAEVTGITLSRSQLDLARERAAAAGLSDRVRFEILDYRRIPFTYDRIVSVGMFEHVGINNYRDYFRHVARCLEPDGIALIHSIGRSLGGGATNAWVRRYIFPGGYVPALSEVMPAVERAQLLTTDIEILRLHYAATLLAWRNNLVAHREQIYATRGERFYRMFEFYLAAAEISFRYGGFMVWQLQTALDHGAVPLTRAYIKE